MRSRLLSVLILLLAITTTWAQKTWDGGGTDNNFSTADNWDDDIAPSFGSNEIYLFDATSTKSCVVDVAVDCDEFQMLSGYTGIIDMNSVSVNVNFSLVVNDGTLISTSGAFSMDGTGSFTLGSGTFSNNGGTFEIYSGASNSFVFSGSIVLNDLTLFTNGASTTSRSVDFGSDLTVTNLLFSATGNRVYALQGTIHIKGGLNMGNSSHTTNSASNSANLIFDGSSANLVGSTSAGSGKAFLPNIEINTTGNYTITNSINVRGNWIANQGTLSVSNSTVNFHNTASISGTAAAFNQIVVQSGVVLTLPASAEVKVSRNLVNSGTISSDPSTLLSMNGGTVAQSISGNAFTMGSLRANSGSRTITLSTALTILDSLKLESNVTFASGGNLTLNADATMQARLATLGSGASVTGNVTVETFVPGPDTGWANWGVNGVMTQSVSHWEAQIPMTCENCPFDVTALGEYFESIQSWDPDNQDYDTLFTYTSPLPMGKGFWVYVGTGFTATSPITLVHTGSLVQGAQNVNVRNDGVFAAEGYNLIANPFASPISWDIVCTENASNFASNLNSNQIFVYNTDIPATTDYIPGTGSSHANGITSILPVGQAFFVDVQAGQNFDIVFSETQKVDANDNGTNPLLRQNSSNPKFRLKIEGSGEYDESLICFNPLASTGYDKKYDAAKKFETPGYFGYPGSYSKYTSISTRVNGKYYSINSMPGLSQTYTLEVLAKASISGNYTISAKDFENFNSCLLLIDELNNVYHNLNNSPYVVHLSDTVNTPHFKLIVCESGNSAPTILKELNVSNSIVILQDGSSALVNTKFERDTKAVISVYNILGQKITNDIFIQGTETSTRIPLDASNQVVFIKVSSEKEVLTKKLLIH